MAPWRVTTTKENNDKKANYIVRTLEGIITPQHHPWRNTRGKYCNILFIFRGCFLRDFFDSTHFRRLASDLKKAHSVHPKRRELSHKYLCNR